MKYILLCEYDGGRHSNPLKKFPDMEAIGPFDTPEEAADYGDTHEYEGCVTHSIVPLVEA